MEMDLVYAIKFAELDVYKIGKTWAPAIRLGQLQAACPFELRIVLVFRGGGGKLETALHKRFRAERMRREWFRIEDGLNVIRHAAFEEAERLGLSILEAGPKSIVKVSDRPWAFEKVSPELAERANRKPGWIWNGTEYVER